METTSKNANLIAARQEMLNLIWSKYGDNYYAVTNEKILECEPDEWNDLSGYNKVEGQAVYIIDKYGKVRRNQIGQDLKFYDILFNLPFIRQREYKQIPIKKLYQIANQRANKITKYIEELKAEEANSGRPVHNDYYFMKIAQQELDDYDNAHYAVNSFYGKYMRTQAENPNAMILQCVGDFYELMGPNAVAVAESLDLTLTWRDVGLSDRVPMCSFPWHLADEYISKLVERGDIVVKDENRVRILKQAQVEEVLTDEEYKVVSTIHGNCPMNKKSVNIEWVSFASTVSKERTLEIVRKYGCTVDGDEFSISEEVRKAAAAEWKRRNQE